MNNSETLLLTKSTGRWLPVLRCVKGRLDLGRTLRFFLCFLGLNIALSLLTQLFQRLAHRGCQNAINGLSSLFALLASASHVYRNDEHKQKKEADVECNARPGSILEKFGLFHAAIMQPAA